MFLLTGYFIYVTGLRLKYRRSLKELIRRTTAEQPNYTVYKVAGINQMGNIFINKNIAELLQPSNITHLSIRLSAIELRKTFFLEIRIFLSTYSPSRVL